MALYMIAGLIYTSEGLGTKEIETTTLVVLISTLCYIAFALILWSFTIIKQKRAAWNIGFICDYTVGAWVKVSSVGGRKTRKLYAVSYMNVRHYTRRQQPHFASKSTIRTAFMNSSAEKSSNLCLCRSWQVAITCCARTLIRKHITSTHAAQLWQSET